MKDDSILELACQRALAYRETVDERSVFPDERAIKGLKAFDEELPECPGDPKEIIELLHKFGSPASVAQTGGRYFGFVNGGITPAALGAKWLADVWDQNAAMYTSSPIASKLEEVCEAWIVTLLGLPETTAVGYVSGSSIATLCGLAAGREALVSALK